MKKGSDLGWDPIQLYTFNLVCIANFIYENEQVISSQFPPV
jgi:hypothetical protein